MAGIGAWVGPGGALAVFLAEAVIGLAIVVAQAAAAGRLADAGPQLAWSAVNLVHVRQVGLDHARATGLACRTVDRPLPYAVPTAAGRAAAGGGRRGLTPRRPAIPEWIARRLAVVRSAPPVGTLRPVAPTVPASGATACAAGRDERLRPDACKRGPVGRRAGRPCRSDGGRAGIPPAEASEGATGEGVRRTVESHRGVDTGGQPVSAPTTRRAAGRRRRGGRQLGHPDGHRAAGAAVVILGRIEFGQFLYIRHAFAGRRPGRGPPGGAAVGHAGGRPVHGHGHADPGERDAERRLAAGVRRAGRRRGRHGRDRRDQIPSGDRVEVCISTTYDQIPNAFRPLYQMFGKGIGTGKPMAGACTVVRE